jgi:hypothetical protein
VGEVIGRPIVEPGQIGLRSVLVHGCHLAF